MSYFTLPGIGSQWNLGQAEYKSPRTSTTSRYLGLDWFAQYVS
jgi:hypothetical protein